MKGSAIVKAIMAEHKIGNHDFFVSKFPEHVAVRRIAIERLNEAGLNKAEIGRVMLRCRSTIRYWLVPGDRDHRMAENRRRNKMTIPMVGCATSAVASPFTN